MIRVALEVWAGASCFRASVWAESIEDALAAAGARYPGAQMSVLFPIEPEGFFVRGTVPAAGTVTPEISHAAAG